MKKLWKRLKHRYNFALGKRRVRRGFCPDCYSSPPMSICQICYGTYDYGPGMTPARQVDWAVQWDTYGRSIDRLLYPGLI